jgi:hypothetical protein
MFATVVNVENSKINEKKEEEKISCGIFVCAFLSGCLNCLEIPMCLNLLGRNCCFPLLWLLIDGQCCCNEERSDKTLQ